VHALRDGYACAMVIHPISGRRSGFLSGAGA
jgi:hypothetical protein